MSIQKNMLSRILMVLAGVAVGLGGALVFSPEPDDETQAIGTPSEPATENSHPLTPQFAARSNRARLMKMENRLNELSGQVSDMEEDRSPEELSGSEEGQIDMSSPEAIEELKAKQIEAWESSLDAHEQENYDPAWAPEAETGFDEDIAVLASKGSFQPLRTSCKSRTCTTSMQWPNYESAVKEYSSLLHSNYQTNCGRSILLPPPSDESLPYQGTILFECDR